MTQQQMDLKTMPLLALRGVVVFPGMTLHFDVARKHSISAVQAAMYQDQSIFLVAQKDLRVEEPQQDDLYSVGCIAQIKQIIKLNSDTLRVVVEGITRARLINLESSAPHYLALVEEVDTFYKAENELLERAAIRSAQEVFQQYSALSGKLSPDMTMEVYAIKRAGELADYLASNILLPPEEKQMILEELNAIDRLEYVIVELKAECEILQIERKIDEKVHSQIDENQRDYYLREQLKAIASELDDADNPQQEAEEYREKILKLHLEDDAQEKLLKEAERLFKMPSGSHEATVVRGYLDTCLQLPWNKMTVDKKDLTKASAILEKEHYGLEKIKERILELIAVRTLAPSMGGQILCLYGPPGTGKTSIAKSIAKCLGRKYVRISLGGIRDESDIRGHRRTYIGAMPGRVIAAMQQAKTKNPLILLDEVDKLASDFRGDPAAALLEALDPEQNFAFRDHFLELPFDLSQVLFITTANRTDTIPPALLDRMEVIELTSYTREEKFQIAKRHLLKKQLKRHGLTARTCKVTDQALYGLIDCYTREAGVRKLERSISALCRKSAKKIVSKEAEKVSIDLKDLQSFLGVAKYKPESLDQKDQIGLVNGLAWTSVGGEMMQIEAAVMLGTGKIILTGSLGDVMKESAQAAVSYIRSHADQLELEADFYKTKDIHIHAPEGAVPKDGPSAGIAMSVAILSALTGVSVRHQVAMTGEITLRGRVLPIGGLKEKTIAAYRAGIETVLIPKDNEPDLSELDPTVREQLCFVPVEQVSEVFECAMSSMDYLKKHSSHTHRRSVPSTQSIASDSNQVGLAN